MIEPSKSSYDIAREFQSRINCSLFADDMTVLAEIIDADRARLIHSMFPIFDILPRLWASGHTVKKCRVPLMKPKARTCPTP